MKRRVCRKFKTIRGKKRCARFGKPKSPDRMDDYRGQLGFKRIRREEFENTKYWFEDKHGNVISLIFVDSINQWEIRVTYFDDHFRIPARKDLTAERVMEVASRIIKERKIYGVR